MKSLMAITWVTFALLYVPFFRSTTLAFLLSLSATDRAQSILSAPSTSFTSSSEPASTPSSPGPTESLACPSPSADSPLDPPTLRSSPLRRLLLDTKGLHRIRRLSFFLLLSHSRFLRNSLIFPYTYLIFFSNHQPSCAFIFLP
jgi:hypothetical protein